MICASCGTENAPGAKFCMECAAPFAPRCPACGTLNLPAAKFCSECATRLVAAPASADVPGQPLPGRPAAARPGTAAPLGGQRPPAPAPVAERRLVSVLFADLVGFTPFAEERDSEDVRETLSRYFEIATDVVGRYGGTVEKFIGDAVMAVWGTPTAHEDDAERAVRAALELVDAVRALAPGISARAGVLTGEVAVTLGAQNQGMVAGDIVNTAARLQSVALPGSVLVGETTERAASRAIIFEPAGEQVVKGKSLPVPAFRAVRVVAERGGRGRSDVLEAPFVGRDSELRLLKDLFHATERERRARLVSVVGAAGIGKRRLAWEFEKYLDGIVGTVWWHRGRSPAYGSGLTFWPLGEMIRGRAGLAENDDEASTRRKIADLLDQLPLTDAERRWIESALLALLGIDTGIGSEQLFGAWRTFFERLAASAPVVLVFEDLHWADTGTLDFIDHLLEWSRLVPLYILTLARPEILERRSDWGKFTSLYLEPLPEPAMRQLLAGLVPGLPDTAAGTIVARAEGIPLYAIETVRVLVADGRLAATGDGTYTPTGDLASIAIPDTLAALIAARLDALDAADRSIVLDAAVLGQSFTPAALAAVSGVDATDLEPRLRSLVRRELFTHESDARSPERGQYVFVQALIREVAYNTLARRDRKARHLAAARYFESLGTDELAGALAAQYLAARENAPDGAEADALATQARIALRGAADRAMALGAFDQAVAYFEQAMSVTSDPAERADLLERAGRAATAAGRYEAAERHLREATDAARALGDRRRTARAVTALGAALNQAYRTHEAIELLTAASAELADLGADPDAIGIRGQAARAYYLSGDYDRALLQADGVLADAEHANLGRIIADTLVTKGTVLALQGRPVEGLGALRAGLGLADAAGLSETVVRAYNNLAAADTSRDPRAALEAGRAGMVVARQLGMRAWIAAFAQAIAEYSLRTGDWDLALTDPDVLVAEQFEGSDLALILASTATIRALRGEDVSGQAAESERLMGDTTDPQMLTSRRFMHAAVAFAAGRFADARHLYVEAAELTPNYRPVCLAAAARLSLWLRDGASAGRHLASIETSGLHGPAIEADVQTIRAGLAALGDQEVEAIGQYREALRAWRDMGLAWDEALAGLDMVTLLDPANDEVRAAGEATRMILARLGAAPFVVRLDGTLASEPQTRPASVSPITARSSRSAGAAPWSPASDAATS